MKFFAKKAIDVSDNIKVVNMTMRAQFECA